jgi:hypothetical protein
MNPDASSHGGKCWFYKNLIMVGRVASHVAFREPTSDERLNGWQPNIPPECSVGIVARKISGMRAYVTRKVSKLMKRTER